MKLKQGNVILFIVHIFIIGRYTYLFFYLKLVLMFIVEAQGRYLLKYFFPIFYYILLIIIISITI